MPALFVTLLHTPIVTLYSNAQPPPQVQAVRHEALIAGQGEGLTPLYHAAWGGPPSCSSGDLVTYLEVRHTLAFL